MVVVVDRHLAEQNEIVAAVLELRGERARRDQTVRRDALDLEQHAAVGTHRQRRTDRLLRGRRSEREDDDFARSRLLFPPQRFLHGELVVGIEDELDARLVERFPVRRRS